MLSRFPRLARLVCATSMLACASDNDPTAPPETSESLLPLRPMLMTEEPTVEEMAEMPAEFQENPTLLEYRTTVAFVEPDGVYAQGYMRYFATDATQQVSLTLRFDDRTVASTSVTGVRENFLPAERTLVTTAPLGVNGSCGHYADGHSSHRVWHKFLISGWKFFSWGTFQDGSYDQAEQPACPSSGTGGGGDQPYDTDCYSCQQWFWYEDGQILDEWWECTPIDARFCEGLAT